MDPDSTYRLWVTATDNEQRTEAAEALAMWIRARGFEPKWTANQKRKFFAWYTAQGVNATEAAHAGPASSAGDVI